MKAHKAIAHFSNIGELQYNWQTFESDAVVGVTNNGKKLYAYDIEDDTMSYNLFYKYDDGDEWLRISLEGDTMYVTQDNGWGGDEIHDTTRSFTNYTKGWEYVLLLTKLGEFVAFKSYL